jgi:hypothetical protein
MITVSWHTVCSPINEGGLGIRSLSNLNKASNLKLFWELLNSDNQWAIFLRSRVMRGTAFIKHHIFSSLWSGIKSQIHHIMDNTCWLLGNGTKINFWLHDWCGTILGDMFPISQSQHIQLLKVSDFITDHH